MAKKKEKKAKVYVEVGGKQKNVVFVKRKQHFEYKSV